MNYALMTVVVHVFYRYPGSATSQTDFPVVPSWPYVPFGAELFLPLGSEVMIKCYTTATNASLAWKLESLEQSTSAADMKAGRPTGKNKEQFLMFMYISS